MPLAPGEELGAYQVRAHLGSGGMGDVYLARDVRLGRDVAVKILREGFSNRPERLRRLEREGRALASLNHSSIAHIYGLDQSPSGPLLVLEYVPGETLADLLVRRMLKLADALHIMLQVSQALEAAHESGIIHRDLKPANIKITPEGQAKVLDFGLAKSLRDEDSAAVTASLAPTITASVTDEGVVLGTAAYMSPEQARGLPLDKRTDIWSFGVVFFECLSGHRVFTGDSTLDTLSAVLNKEPNWEALPLGTPTRIRKLLERCLERDRNHRLRDIGEARIAIEDCLARPELPASGVRRPLLRMLIPWVTAGALSLLLVGTSWIAWRGRRHPRAPVMQFSVNLGTDPELTRTQASNVIISPDGMRLAFRGNSPAGIVLYTRALEENQALALAGTEGVENPFFSPDGQWIAFFAGGKLKKIPATGGTVSVLCDAPTNRGGSWGDDGNIIAALSNGAGLSRVPAQGGQVQTVTQLRTGEVTHRWPHVLPNAKAALFTANTAIGGGFDDATIDVQPLQMGERKTLVRGGHYGRYADSGHLLFVRRRVLYAAPLDLGRLELTGSPFPLLENVRSSAVLGGAQIDVSRTGTLVYVRGEQSRGTIAALDISGITRVLSKPAEFFSSLRSSPDGKRVSVDLVENGNLDIWVYQLDRNTSTRLTSTPGTDAWPIWTPDGKHIVFSSARHGGAENLYWMAADGAGEPSRLTESKELQRATSISSDGTQLLFEETSAQTGSDIWTVNITEVPGERPRVGRPERLLGTQYDERDAQISPDGRWLAYRSSESGSHHVYVRRFPQGGKMRISAEPAGPPRWSRKKKELFYATASGLLATGYSTASDTFIPGKTNLRVPYQSLSSRSYEIVPADDSVLFLQPEVSDPESTRHATFILNFFDKIGRGRGTGN